MKLKSLIPYRIRLWWAARKMPICTCGKDSSAPPWHLMGCPVYEEWFKRWKNRR